MNESVSEQVNGKRKRKVFYLCETKHVLLYFLILKFTHHRNDQVDLYLTDTTDWGSIGTAVEGQGVFHKVYRLPMREINVKSGLWPKKEVRHNQLLPSRLFPTVPKVGYDEAYFNLASFPSRLLWAALCMKGAKKPQVNFIEEGTASYNLTLPTSAALAKVRWSAAIKYMKSIGSLWLTRPELFSGNLQGRGTVCELDLSIVNDPAFAAACNAIFTASTIPQEKFIYFEECYIRNRHSTNDLELLEKVAEIVGKENILVRLHPKTEVDRFTPFGFKVEEKNSNLWELACMSGDFSEKVFITIKSTAALSGVQLSSKPPAVIMLMDLVEGHFPNKSSESFNTYLQNIKRSCTQSHEVLFIPQTLEELEIMVRAQNGLR